MQPELFPGDILIATKGRFKSLKVGDKIIFSVPGYPMMVKKIIGFPSPGVMDVHGSHPESIDSKHFGYVTQKHYLAKVVTVVEKPFSRR